MKKEALTFKNAKRDLDSMAFSRMSSAEDHRLVYKIPAVLLAVILAVVFKSVIKAHTLSPQDRRSAKDN